MKPLKTPSRTNSELIRAFTLARQELQIEEDKRRLASIQNIIVKRQEERDAIFGKDAKKKEKSLATSIKGSEKYKTMDEHKIELDDLFKKLEVNPQIGLSDSQAHERNLKYGDNSLSKKKKKAWYLQLLHELTGFFALLLWAGGILSIIAYLIDREDPANLYLGIVLFVVNFLTGLVTFFQNANSEALVEAFKNFIPPSTRVFRNGTLSNLDAAKLVPGDIVELKSGDRVPADVRILFCQELRVDNSSLTGESDPLLRTVECTNKENPLETDNLAFFGTMIKEGIGRGIVIQIGDETVIGQIANLASTAGVQVSPLRREINRFIMIVTCIACSFGIFFFVAGFALGYPAITNVIFAIGIIVANVPEGLLATVTAALAITAKKLSRKKVLVKNLEAVETLGSTSCICSDKTGTLTQNKMTVEHLWYGGIVYRGLNYQKMGSNYSFEYDKDSNDFRTLQENAILCSEAIFDNTVPSEKLSNLHGNEAEVAKKRHQINEDYQKELERKLYLERPTIGDASETALIKFYQPIHDIEKMRTSFDVKEMDDKSLAKIPFNSAWKYSLAIREYKTQDSVNCIFIKGAPEKIWSLCSHINVDGKPEPIDDQWKKQFKDVNLKFGNGGERVLGFAKMHLPKDKYPENFQFNCKNVTQNNFPMTGFVFSGLVSLVDPPRDSVPFSVLKCKTAGIKVIMVTGDQPVTAAAIARQVNIFGRDEKTVNQIAEEKGISFEEAFDQSDSIVIHGDLITQATQEDELLPEGERGRTLARWLEKPKIVFARTTPAQKLIIVKGCQQQGHIVAVTGDGVNDSPAIKKADIGIAMGVTGSDVAKDAADMILLTDDFSAIILGIEEGRKIFDNLKKSIAYCLTSNIPELTPFLCFVIFRFPLPLSTILVLAIDLGTDVIPAVAFASENAELGIMLRPPRKKTDHLVTRKLLGSVYFTNGIFQSCSGFLCYIVVMRDFGFPLAELFGLSIEKGIKPNPHDVYDPNAAYFGNTSEEFIDYCNSCMNGGDCSLDSYEPPNWLYNTDKDVDLRLWYLKCNPDGTIENTVNVGACRIKQISPISDVPVCYTPDALKYAQTAFFFAIVFCQICNSFNCKTKEQSFIMGGLSNFSLIFGFCNEITLCLVLAYARPINFALNSRDVIFLHFGIPGLPFCVISFLYDEGRKFLIRNLKPSISKKPNWFKRNHAW